MDAETRVWLKAEVDRRRRAQLRRGARERTSCRECDRLVDGEYTSDCNTCRERKRAKMKRSGQLGGNGDGRHLQGPRLDPSRPGIVSVRVSPDVYAMLIDG